MSQRKIRLLSLPDHDHNWSIAVTRLSKSTERGSKDLIFAAMNDSSSSENVDNLQKVGEPKLVEIRDTEIAGNACS
jgi:hypothetical protein